MRKALIGYERVYMLSPERLSRSVDEHEAIVAALEPATTPSPRNACA